MAVAAGLLHNVNYSYDIWVARQAAYGMQRQQPPKQHHRMHSDESVMGLMARAGCHGLCTGVFN